MSSEGKSLFNQVTNLKDRANYSRGIEENKEMYDYQTTSFKQPVCFMKGQTLQGFSIQEPPPALIDVESYLKTQPLRNEIDQNVFEGDLRNTSPSMPEELKTRLFIPDCADFIDRTYLRERQADVGFNREKSLADGTDPHGPKRQVYIASPGIDTRMAMKDEYKRRADAKLAGLYGKGAGDIIPAPEIPCKLGDSRQCMHLFPAATAAAAAESTIKTFQPSAPLATFARAIGQPTTAATYNNGGVPTMGALVSPGPDVVAASQPQGPVAYTTAQVLQTIPPDMTLRQLAEEYALRRGCDVSFLGYKSPCASVSTTPATNPSTN